MSNFNRQIKGMRNTRRATECNTLAIQKILKEEAKIAVPLPTESVIDVYMKTRDETNPENRNQYKLGDELVNVLNKAYLDRMKLAEQGWIPRSLTPSQYAEIGVPEPSVDNGFLFQYAEYDSAKYRVVNDAKIQERAYIEGKREQWIDDQMMPRIKECMDTINMNIPLTTIITTSPNTHTANVQTRKNASISNRMKNLGNLFPNNRRPISISNDMIQQGGSRKTTRKQRRNRNRTRNRNRK